MSVQDCITDCVAETSNIMTHFVQPLKQHDHKCFCLLCGNSKTNHTCQLHSTNHLANATLSLLPAATATDLDLVSTGSTAIRQVVVLFRPEEQNETNDALDQLLLGLKHHLGYSIHMESKNDTFNFQTHNFHILCLLFCQNEPIPVAILHQLEQLCSRQPKIRIVLLAHKSQLAPVQTLPTINMNQSTLLWYLDFDFVVSVFLHVSMITKQRMLVKDLSKYCNELKFGVMCSSGNDCVFF